jgi:hypothetical protein
MPEGTSPVLPSEVAALADRLHEQGVVNLDLPVRTYMEQLRSLGPDSTMLGSYGLAWSSYFLICKE